MGWFGGDFLALAAAFLLAGLFAGYALVPERLGGWDRLFLSLALAVPATILAAAPGIATHSLAAWSIVAGLGALGALGAWRTRDSLRRALPAARSLRSRARPPRALTVLFATAALAMAWFAVLVPEGIEDSGSGRPNGTIVYYHWGIVSKVVEDGGLPATIPEWGKEREFPYEYGFSVMHGAATAVLAGDSGFVLEERYRLAMVVCLLLALFALWRRWLPPWWAWLAAVLSLNVSRIETRMLVYKPEAFALVLVIWSAWMLDEALDRRSRLWGAMAGLVLASSFLAHPIGSLLVAPLWGGILAGRVLPELWRRRGGRRSTGPVVALRAVLPAVIVFALLFGGLRAAIGSTGQDLAQSPEQGVDLTRVVYNLSYVSSNANAEPRVPECGDPFGVYSTVRPFYSSHASWFFFDPGSLSSLLLILGAVVVLGGLFLLQSPPRLARWPAAAKRALLTWSFYALGVYLLAALICAYYSTWVPERVGPMRLMPYWALILPGLIAGVAWAISALTSRRLGKAAAASLAIVLAGLATWTFTAADADRERGVPPFYVAEPRVGGLAEEARATYLWIGDNLPRRAVILTNGYVEGALGMLSGRTGLLDGRAPFAQPDPWRAEAIHLLTRSRAFFKRPRSAPIPAATDYVLVSREDVNLGGSYFPTDFRALARLNRLEPVRRGKGIVLYRVRRDGRPNGDRPSGHSTVTSAVEANTLQPWLAKAVRAEVPAAFRRSC